MLNKILKNQFVKNPDVFNNRMNTVGFSSASRAYTPSETLGLPPKSKYLFLAPKTYPFKKISDISFVIFDAWMPIYYTTFYENLPVLFIIIYHNAPPESNKLQQCAVCSEVFLFV